MCKNLNTGKVADPMHVLALVGKRLHAERLFNPGVKIDTEDFTVYTHYTVYCQRLSLSHLASRLILCTQG